MPPNSKPQLLRKHLKGSGMPGSALVISVNDLTEHDFTVYNKSIFLGETATLVDHHEGWSSTVLDVTYQGLTLSQLIPVFLSQPRVVLFYAETNQSRLVFRLATMAKTVSPKSSIMVFGLATTFIPQYFGRPPFDAVHVSGDREAAISGYLRFLDGSIDEAHLEGLLLVRPDGTHHQTPPGRWLPPADWPTPTLSKLPLESYRAMQSRRTGVVDCTLGLAITATKGCETQCNFCGCSEEEGVADRTRDPAAILAWYDANASYLGEAFHLYSPNILSSPAWVRRFHQLYMEGGYSFSWQGVSRTNTLTDEVVALAAEAGLKKLSIGIEHISAQRRRPIKSSLDELEAAAACAKRYGVQLVGLLMLGYPQQTITDVRYILATLAEFGITAFRFTGYTPLHKLRGLTVDELDRTILEDYDRRTFYSPEMRITPTEFYDILISNGRCLSASQGRSR